jgi:polar amino acid transport system substrate-binding protein
MSFNKFFKSTLFCLFLVSSFAYAHEKKVSLTYLNYPPYCSQHLENGGPMTEIILSAFEHQGYEVSLEQLPWKRAFEWTKEGKFDGIFTGWYRDERTEHFAYSSALPPNEIVLFKQKETEIEFTSYDDLRPYTIGIVNGYANPEGFDEAGLNVAPVIEDKQNILKLGSARIDLALVDKATGNHIIRTQFPHLENKLDWLEPPLKTETQHIMFSRNAEGYQQKVEDFNAGLKHITETGKLQEILNKHGM